MIFKKKYFIILMFTIFFFSFFISSSYANDTHILTYNSVKTSDNYDGKSTAILSYNQNTKTYKNSISNNLVYDSFNSKGKIENKGYYNSNVDYDRLTADCCSVVLHVNKDSHVFAFRRDSSYSANLYIKKINIGAKEGIKEYKTRNGYFLHSLVTEDGWYVGNGGPDIVYINKGLENIAVNMISKNTINNYYMGRANSLLKKLSLGHFVIKSPNGKVGILIKNGRSSKYSIFTMKNGEFVSIPNSPKSYRRGSYLKYSKDPVTAAIKIAGTDRWGINRKNIMTYSTKSNYDYKKVVRDNKTVTLKTLKNRVIEVFATWDTGKLLGRKARVKADNVYFFSKYISAKSIPIIPYKKFIGRIVFN